MEDEVRDPYEYEVDLRDYIKVIWEKKWLITLVFVIAVGAALGFSLTTTPKYRTQASLIITSSIADQLVSQPVGTQNQVDFVSEFDYEEVAFSDDVLKSIITDLDLTTSSGESKSLDSLKNQLAIDLASPGNSDDNIEKPLLTLTVTGSKRARIKEIANTWAELYFERASEILTSEIDRYNKLASDEYSSIKKELDEKIEERIEARAEHNPELLKIEADILKNRYRDYLSSLESKKLSLEKKRTQLQKLNSILESEPRYLELERSIPAERLLGENQSPDEVPEGERSDGNDNTGKLEEKTLKLTDQKVNELFLTFRRKEIDADVEASSLEKEVNYLTSKLVEFRSKINEKQATIDRVQANLEELNKEINQLEKTSDSLFSALEEARTASNEASAIRTLNSASSVNTVESVNTKQNVAVAGVLGLFIGVLVAFLKNYMEDYEGEASEEETGESENQE